MKTFTWTDKCLSGWTVEREENYPHPREEGLRLRATPNAKGTRLVWQYRRMVGGNLINRALGKFPTLTISEARQVAADVNKRIAMGEAPFAEGKQALTVREAWDQYRAYMIERRRDISYSHGPFDNDVLPTIGDMALVDVEPADIRTVMRLPLIREQKGLSGNVVAANTNLVVMRTMFNWAVRNRLDGLQWSPANAVEKIEWSALPRYALNIEQMALAIHAARDMDRERGTTWASILTLFFLLGNRRNEIMYMPVSEWDSADQLWRLLGPRYKTGRNCVLPVGPWANSIMNELAESAGKGRFMIPNQFGVRTQTFHVTKTICARMNLLAAELRLPEVPRWTMHSTRYGFRSEIVNYGICGEDMAERIIHPRAKPSMARHYHRGFESHMRAALTAWELRLQEEVARVAALRLRNAA